MCVFFFFLKFRLNILIREHLLFFSPFPLILVIFATTANYSSLFLILMKWWWPEYTYIPASGWASSGISKMWDLNPTPSGVFIKTYPHWQIHKSAKYSTNESTFFCRKKRVFDLKNTQKNTVLGYKPTFWNVPSGSPDTHIMKTPILGYKPTFTLYLDTALQDRDLVELVVDVDDVVPAPDVVVVRGLQSLVGLSTLNHLLLIFYFRASDFIINFHYIKVSNSNPQSC